MFGIETLIRIPLRFVVNMAYDFAVIFDMDGVIVDNSPFHVKAWQEFLRREGFDMTEDQVKGKFFGRVNADAFEMIFGKKLDKQAEARMTEQKESIYREIYASDIKPVKGLPEFLEILKSNGTKTAIATSAYSKNVDFVLSKTGLREYFDVILDDSHVTKGKPDPQIYLKTAEQLGVEPAKCIVVEDSLHGVDSGLNAGMKVIGLTTMHTKEELSHANFVINDFTELDVEILQSLFS